MDHKVSFNHRWLPVLLVAPQLVITVVFFLWPSGQALYQSMLMEDAFGFSTEFVGTENFIRLFTDQLYLDSFFITLQFSFSVAFFAMSISLLLAVLADGLVRGAQIYKTLLIWPYAVAPVVAGVLWLLLFNPTIGVLAFMVRGLGFDWNPFVSGNHAMWMVVIAATWKQISYNFLFFLAGLQSVPASLIEAAAMDGAGPAKRFWTIVFPLLSPTTFFLLVVNLVYAFFDTFGVIHAMTGGGPGTSTSTMVYKVFSDGFIGLDLGASAAQSVILMILVGAMTVVQFKYIEKKVAY